MKVTFFSSVLNHHQIEFCDEMYTKLGNGFKFVLRWKWRNNERT